MTRAARGFLIAFIVDSVIHLTAVAIGLNTAANVTKPLLLLLLIGVVVSNVSINGHPSLPWLIGGQLFSCIGDVALIPDGTMYFIAGMAGFAAAQICYITGYFRLGAKTGYAQRRWVLIVYPLFWLAANAALWSGLGAMRLPIAIYSLALVAMAMTSMSLGTVFGIGGTLFMLSDLTIGENVAYGDFPGSHFLIMATYIAGQVIICLCWLDRVQQQSAPVGAPGALAVKT